MQPTPEKSYGCLKIGLIEKEEKLIRDVMEAYCAIKDVMPVKEFTNALYRKSPCRREIAGGLFI